MSTVQREKMMRRCDRRWLAAVVCLSSFCLLPSAFSQVPLQFTYQGRLTDSYGVPVVGVSTATFNLYKGGSVMGDGTNVFSETWTNLQTDVNGVFSGTIGAISNMPLTALADGTTANRYIEVVLNGQTNRPRQQLVSVPYAVVAGSAVGSGQNLLINGGFDFWQRGTNFSGPVYGADRWLASADTSEFSRKPGGPSPRSAYHALQRAGRNATLAQRIESPNARLLTGRQVTLSFLARADASHSVKVRVSRPQMADNYLGGTNLVFDVTLGVTTSVWNPFSHSFPVTETMASNGFEVAIGNSDTGGGETVWEFAEIMLNEGAAVLPFRRAGSSIGAELNLCERYFQKFVGAHSPVSYDTSFSECHAAVQFRQPMRRVPNIAVIGAQINRHHGLIPTLNDVNRESVAFTWTGSAARDGGLALIDLTADAEL